jgi:hypothetical protein
VTVAVAWIAVSWTSESGPFQRTKYHAECQEKDRSVMGCDATLWTPAIEREYDSRATSDLR